MCLVTWPWTWIASEAGVDLVLIQTSVLFICKCKLVRVLAKFKIAGVEDPGTRQNTPRFEFCEYPGDEVNLDFGHHFEESQSSVIKTKTTSASAQN